MLDLLLAILVVLAAVLVVALAMLAGLAAVGAVWAGRTLERFADVLIPGRKTGLGPEGVIGEEARVTREFSPVPESDLSEGMVQIGGELWMARSSAKPSIGSRVRVASVDGLTLVVEPLGRSRS